VREREREREIVRKLCLNNIRDKVEKREGTAPQRLSALSCVIADVRIIESLASNNLVIRLPLLAYILNKSKKKKRKKYEIIHC
jgi:hypothetical protein